MSKKAKVLVVDDDPLNRLVLEKTLCEEHDVFLAKSAEEALAFVRTTQFDLILLDIVMPVMNGFELIVKLKENPITQAIPVIFISANQEHADESKGLELGAMDYITKPFSASIVRGASTKSITDKTKKTIYLKC